MLTLDAFPKIVYELWLHTLVSITVLTHYYPLASTLYAQQGMLSFAHSVC